jgi:hypothetical protein
LSFKLMNQRATLPTPPPINTARKVLNINAFHIKVDVQKGPGVMLRTSL